MLRSCKKQNICENICEYSDQEKQIICEHIWELSDQEKQNICEHVCELSDQDESKTDDEVVKTYILMLWMSSKFSRENFYYSLSNPSKNHILIL